MPNLTKRIIDSIAAPTTADEFYWDTSLPGFGLRVYRSGRKVFVAQYRNAGGQTKRVTLGRYGTITLDTARKNAKLVMSDVAAGQDPSDLKRRGRIAPDMNTLFDDYLTFHAKPHKRTASVKEDERLWASAAKSKIGGIKVDAVLRRDIESILRGLASTPYQANRVRALLSKMFSLAVGWSMRTDNPMTGIPKHPEESRTRWLTADELKSLFSALNLYPGQTAADAVRFIALTGARRGEVLKARWSEFDLTAGTWTRPSAHTKQKRDSRIPLSPQAIALLKARHDPQRENDLVFPGRNGAPRSDLNRVWRHCKTHAKLHDVRLHDLRHTFASHLVSAGESLVIVGSLLGHTQSATTMRYAHIADAAQRKATDRIGDLIEQSVSSASTAEIVPIHGGSK